MILLIIEKNGCPEGGSLTFCSFFPVVAFTNTCASVIRESEDSGPKVSVNELIEEHAVFSASPSTQMLTVYFNVIFSAPFFENHLLALIFIFVPFIKETFPLQKVLVSRICAFAAKY